MSASQFVRQVDDCAGGYANRGGRVELVVWGKVSSGSRAARLLVKEWTHSLARFEVAPFEC